MSEEKLVLLFEYIDAVIEANKDTATILEVHKRSALRQIVINAICFDEFEGE